MQKLEATAPPRINPKLWLRYVDDTFSILKKDHLKPLYNAINSTIPDIKFTLEKEVDTKFPFLDVLVQRKPHGTLRTTVYRRETYAVVILNYESNQPISEKRSVVSTDQIKVLQHESGFNTGDANIVDFIASLEATLSKTQTTEDAKNSIRQPVASLIISHRPRQTNSPAEIKAIMELMKDEEIVIVPADKGRATVILDKLEYVAKAQELLNNTQSYKVVESDPIKTLVGKIKESLNLMRSQKAISENDWRQMKPQDATLARFYGLPKIHKPNVPLRPIVALKGTPTYGLAKWLAKHLKKLVDGSEHTAVSSTHFLEKLRGITIAPDEIMGTSMGSPISGYLAEAMMQELETRVFQNYKPEFWMRYVDDTFVIMHREAKENFKRDLNSIFPQIQFTTEEEQDGILPFLDRNVSEATERVLRPLNVSVGHRPEATIRRLVMQLKGRLSPADTSGVIYRVNCLDCPANYCGMTDKRLSTRMHEHTLAVRRKDIRSYVAMNSPENNHRFDFDGAQVIG
ncbi:unnamed protein product [Schistocephalus solidus]|uniref:Reverse transcriptase domain-containing protein n=1 Tax=Schistocephalus solidus TaxID=70667 RepID=A0A183TD97_SCHSO|nr:unnamed protein product [Schistocephalus solidus]